MEKLLSFLWPIKKEENSKFFPLAFMLFFTIFCYTTLKAMKDSLIVPNVGAEAISFIKFYFVVPAAIMVVILYIYLSNRFRFHQIYFGIGIFYVVYFLVFAFVLYPIKDYIHPAPETINSLIYKELNLVGFKIQMTHFKWFFLLYGKWLYVVFYVLAELWSSTMAFLLFWQFSNRIVGTDEAKRFYPMVNLLGSLGNFVSGSTIKYFSTLQKALDVAAKSQFMVQFLLSAIAFAAVCILFIFRHMNNSIVKRSKNAKDSYVKESSVLKKKTPLSESLKVVFSSKYIGYIAVLVLSYGIAINLLEGPWKSKIKEMYPDTDSYLYFMGSINQWNGSLAIIFSLVGVSIMRKYSWFTAAIITPIMIFVTGICFFTLIVFENAAHILISSFFVVNPLMLAVLLGAVQNVLSKSSKYSLFDSTREMTYIPIDEELRSKGKAAVDVVGARLAKSGGALVQSMLFMIFPAATYTSIAPFLMIVFAVVTIIWIINVRVLNKEYLKYLNKAKS